MFNERPAWLLPLGLFLVGTRLSGQMTTDPPVDTTRVLVLLNGQLLDASAGQTLVAAHLQGLGATAVKRYSAFSGLSATLPSINLDALAGDSAVSRIWQFPAGSKNPMLELLDRIDGAAAASSPSVISATLPDEAGSPDNAFSQLIDRLIDQNQLTLLLAGGTGVQSDAITLTGSADGSIGASAGMHKPDFVAASSSDVQQAIGVLSQAGLNQPIAQKALLINTAGSSSGWSTASGWGAIDLSALQALTSATAGAPICMDRDQTPHSAPASCFLGSQPGMQIYETNSSAPVKLTLTWNRSFAADGTVVPSNFELHVYDHSKRELANAVSATGNVLQVIASNDSGVVIRIVSNNSQPVRYALASSTPLLPMASTSCTGVTVSSTNITFPTTGGTATLTYTIPPSCSGALLLSTGTATAVQWYTGSGTNDGVPGTYTLTFTSSITNTTGNTWSDQAAFELPSDDYVVVSPIITFTQPSSTTNCTYTATSTGSLSEPYSGGSGGISITASPSTCASSVASSSAWLNFASASGTGNWTATFTDPPNVQLNASSTSRTASLTVSAPASGSGSPFSQSFTVTQAGLTCAATVPSATINIPAAGIPQSSPQSFRVTLSSAGCQWNAASSTSFLHVVNDSVTQTGSTTYTVQYWADANTSSSSRPATAQVAGQTVDFAEEGTSPTPPKIPPVPEVTVLTPKAGATVAQGGALAVTFTVSSGSGNATFQLTDPSGKVISALPGTVAYTQDQVATYPWTVPATQTPGQYQIQVSAGGKANSGTFTVTAQAKTITVSAPNPPVFDGGAPQTAKWTYSGFGSAPTDTVDVVLLNNGNPAKTNSGMDFGPIATGLPLNTTNFPTWSPIVLPAGAQYQIKVSTTGANPVVGLSPEFAIQVLKVTLFAPLAESASKPGDPVTITWSLSTTPPSGSTVRFFLSGPNANGQELFVTDAIPLTLQTTIGTIPTTTPGGQYTLEYEFNGVQPTVSGTFGAIDVQTIKITAPTGSSPIWQVGTTQNIQWQGSIGPVTIKLDSTELKSNLPVSGTYAWAIPNTVSAGPHTITVTEGIASDSTTISILVPSIQMNWPPGPWKINTSVNVSWTVTGQYADGAALEFLIGGMPIAANALLSKKSIAIPINSKNGFQTGSTYTINVVLTGDPRYTFSTTSPSITIEK